MIQPPYANGGGGFGEIPATSIFEGYVTPFDDLIRDSPEESKVSDLTRGKTIGLSVVMCDFDSSSELWDTHVLAGKDKVWMSADYFADFLLVGPWRETEASVGSTPPTNGPIHALSISESDTNRDGKEMR